MGKIILITGGARSGKSKFAEKITKGTGNKITYIATAIPFDEGMKDRIKKHKESRPQEWNTIEKYKDFKKLDKDENFIKADTVLLDCITLMVTNILMDSGLDFDKCSMEEIDKVEDEVFYEVKGLIKIAREYNKNLVFVTNEVGMGLVPPYRFGNIFRDIAGRVNQYLASEAEEVYFTVSGIPMKIK
ncbi:bifunctional adenosylcobinamide kinase/adenosylcobinamide-phosphate guanylyltransferase [Thermohalobacter berrensis]|uniref:Adenosylcobinamide kinase n=1 Tax=Thermohalobacter berrensis TaxID=99594 RepID=A0A419SZJ4_9FIRM|nr:bifunctional adenosylcobinamide kinase/adenosylcobinamide-phosphate guanylyltransferase [Thermohalobacter berrensis]RKD30588.1 bifunctional adenosylcobinamide kinase/adenosylcobinamide-phosphate guanylyltransferase [Thermohalobacter berrensis]